MGNSLSVSHIRDLCRRSVRGSEEEDLGFYASLFRTDAIRTHGVQSDGADFSGCQGE